MKLFLGKMASIKTEYIVSLVFFTIFYLACFGVAYCILAQKFKTYHNFVVGIYAFFIFFFGFVLMAAEGSGLAALEAISMKHIE